MLKKEAVEKAYFIITYLTSPRRINPAGETISITESVDFVYSVNKRDLILMATNENNLLSVAKRALNSEYWDWVNKEFQAKEAEINKILNNTELSDMEIEWAIGDLFNGTYTGLFASDLSCMIRRYYPEKKDLNKYFKKWELLKFIEPYRSILDRYGHRIR